MIHAGSDKRSPSVERTVMFTDAVVAIAMTLLVLPLVELVPEVDIENAGAVFGEHLSLFVSFVVSFLVILLFWAAHQRVFAQVPAMTRTMRLLNAAWLLLVAFLPFPTALLGRGPTTSTAPLYIATVLLLSLVTVAMTVAAAGSAEDPAAAEHLRRHAVVAAVSSGVLLACALVATVNADAGLIGLLAVAVVRLGARRWTEGSMEAASS